MWLVKLLGTLEVIDMLDRRSYTLGHNNGIQDQILENGMRRRETVIGEGLNGMQRMCRFRDEKQRNTAFYLAEPFLELGDFFGLACSLVKSFVCLAFRRLQMKLLLETYSHYIDPWLHCTL